MSLEVLDLDFVKQTCEAKSRATILKMLWIEYLGNSKKTLLLLQ